MSGSVRGVRSVRGGRCRLRRMTVCVRVIARIFVLTSHRDVVVIVAVVVFLVDWGLQRRLRLRVRRV